MLKQNVQIQHGKTVFVEEALLYTREMLAVSFDRLASHLFLVGGHEIHCERFVIEPSLVCGVCTYSYLNGKMIALLILGRPDPLLFVRGCDYVCQTVE